MARFRVTRGAVVGAVLLLLIAVGAFLAYHVQVTDDRLKSDAVAGGIILDEGNMTTQPGQSGDFSAVILNPGYAHIVFVSAALIPIKGYPVPRLVHLGLLPADPNFGSPLESDSGWPPGSMKVRVRPFAGAGLSHGEVGVVFGIVGDSSQNYAVAGLRIRYRVEGNTHYLTAWSAAVICVSASADNWSTCNSVLDKVLNHVSELAGVIPPSKFLTPA